MLKQQRLKQFFLCLTLLSFIKALQGKNDLLNEIKPFLINVRPSIKLSEKKEI